MALEQDQVDVRRQRSAGARRTETLMKDLEKYQLPEGEPAALPDGTSGAGAVRPDRLPGPLRSGRHPQHRRGRGAGALPDGLDHNAARLAKAAAAKAFLGAIGKAAKDVITDAGRKITVVRAVADAKRADTEHGGRPSGRRRRRSAAPGGRASRPPSRRCTGSRVRALAVRRRGVTPAGRPHVLRPRRRGAAAPGPPLARSSVCASSVEVRARR